MENENKYIIRIDSNNVIMLRAYTFDYLPSDIELSVDEYELALRHAKFNPETREFSEEIIREEILTKEDEIETLRNAINELSIIVGGMM